MDLQGAASISSQPIPSSAHSGSTESVVVSQQIPEDSVTERREVARSDAGADRGAEVDVEA